MSEVSRDHSTLSGKGKDRTLNGTEVTKNRRRVKKAEGRRKAYYPNESMLETEDKDRESRTIHL
jgi:hypothetical protein